MARYNRWLLNWWPFFLVPLTVSFAVAVWGAVTMLHQEPPRVAQPQTAAVPAADEAPDEEQRLLVRYALIEHSLNKKGYSLPGLGIAGGLIDNDPDKTEPSDPTDTLGQEETASAGPEGTGPDFQKAFEESRNEASKAYDDVERIIAEQAKRAHVVIELDRAMQVGRDYTAS